ncbi:hypothetical protein T265_09186 [Opisthorchis viverrini]|uniref:Uncharacterized protein n=1 Tax=Opisthorchis viverrini TaxID=6198 RepID=A0A074Z6H9_OPIVI|nr:hypothetical protein T265_09186 [Opisthorchis viverrini]KER22781.1 hypothetical protein T265_09186 [Opisthorchis viverrini]
MKECTQMICAEPYALIRQATEHDELSLATSSTVLSHCSFSAFPLLSEALIDMGNHSASVHYLGQTVDMNSKYTPAEFRELVENPGHIYLQRDEKWVQSNQINGSGGDSWRHNTTR